MEKGTKKQKKEVLVKEVPFAWRVHTPNLLSEIINGHTGGWIFRAPMIILGELLHQLGERAAQINDPELNALMCRLTIYAIANPSDPEYDQEKVNRILVEAEQVKQKRKFDNR
jgi:hypothetical protein